MNDFKLTPAEARAALVEDLRSGNHRQGQGVLRNACNEFCCLGRACDLFLKIEGRGRWSQTNYSDDYVFNDGDGDTSAAILPAKVKEWLGFSTGSGCMGMTMGLTTCNDNGEDFPTIACRIENDEVLLRETV